MITEEELAAQAEYESEIRADERRRIMFEMAELARELQAAGRITASGLVKDMWTRVSRRLDK
jgi:hypothetical protein